MGKQRSLTTQTSSNLRVVSLSALSVCVFLLISTYLDILVLENRVGIALNGKLYSYAIITELIAGCICVFWFTKRQDAKTLLVIASMFLIWIVLTMNILSKVGR